MDTCTSSLPRPRDGGPGSHRYVSGEGESNEGSSLRRPPPSQSTVTPYLPTSVGGSLTQGPLPNPGHPGSAGTRVRSGTGPVSRVSRARQGAGPERVVGVGGQSLLSVNVTIVWHPRRPDPTLPHRASSTRPWQKGVTVGNFHGDPSHPGHATGPGRGGTVRGTGKSATNHPGTRERTRPCPRPRDPVIVPRSSLSVGVTSVGDSCLRRPWTWTWCPSVRWTWTGAGERSGVGTT